MEISLMIEEGFLRNFLHNSPKRVQNVVQTLTPAWSAPVSPAPARWSG